MNANDIVTPSWSTASFGDVAGTSPLELSAQGEHMDLCKASQGRVFALHCLRSCTVLPAIFVIASFAYFTMSSRLFS